MTNRNADPRCYEPDVLRLIGLPAWERAKVYAAANLGLGERSMIEGEVRARIAREFRNRR